MHECAESAVLLVVTAIVVVCLGLGCAVGVSIGRAWS